MSAQPIALETSPEFHRQISAWLAFFRYILQRVLAIALTIFLGVFITVVIANHRGGLDRTVSINIGWQFNPEVWDAQRSQMEAAEGVSLSFLPKHVIYTFKALGFDWGNILNRRQFNTWINTSAGSVNTTDSRAIVFSRLPYTLLLSGSAFLLLTLIGIPLALYLSQHEGNGLDKLFGLLSPLSSVPCWITGILLTLVFSIQLHLFPAGRLYDGVPPQTTEEIVLTTAYHMVLPIAAILLSLLFQLVYTWRTYFLIYANEDYLLLAKAKGLRKNTIDTQYILKPALPYIITNLAITLIGFWQVTAALEFFFQWPGIGKMFIDAMPNFHSESMAPGEMSLVVNLVVLFAYLLGATVFLLDLSYYLLDPRVRFEAQRQPLYVSPRPLVERLLTNRSGWKIHLPPRSSWRLPQRLAGLAGEVGQGLAAFARSCAKTWRDLARIPSGRIGLALLTLLVLVSGLTLALIPYEPTVREWSSSGLGDAPTAAKMALPKWVNWFRKEALPPTQVINGRKSTPGAVSADYSQVQLDFDFSYPYQEFPSEIALYLTPTFGAKKPFITLTWLTPDGREIQLNSRSIDTAAAYDFNANIPVTSVLRKYDGFKRWFIPSGSQKTPEYLLLFANPALDQASVLNGKYTLRVRGNFFETGGDLTGKLVVFGRVEGWAGTDYLRRDLSIPLLWGLPVALLIGVSGTVLTSLIALVLAAASAWLGGWVDSFVQRITEVNLILPVLVIGVLLYALYQISLWPVIGLIMLSSVFGSSIKSYRAAFLQEKEAGYIEAAKMYGASDGRIILQYLARRILPAMIPQMVMLIPNFIFLEATLAIFNIFDVRYPTWGRTIYLALRYGSLYGSRYWVLEPLALMLITGLTFILLSFALNRLLIPHITQNIET